MTLMWGNVRKFEFSYIFICQKEKFQNGWAVRKYGCEATWPYKVYEVIRIAITYGLRQLLRERVRLYGEL